MHPQWGTQGHGWPQLAALIVNLTPILELGTRILIGLTNHQGVVYHEIKHLHPMAFIEALELIDRPWTSKLSARSMTSFQNAGRSAPAMNVNVKPLNSAHKLDTDRTLVAYAGSGQQETVVFVS
jgi:hypothetical protein